jgi:hypothetical protein
VLARLDAAALAEHVRGPGIALIDWRNPRDARSVLFEQALEHASRIHGDVRFGSVDVAADPGLAREWGIGDFPTLLAYRDGILVFRYPGPLPPPVIEGLLEALQSLDMDEVRSGVDGQGARISIAFQPEREPPLQPAGDTGKKGGGGTPRGRPR